MNSTLLLTKLEHQLDELAKTLAPIADNQALRPRFDRQLFHSQSTRLTDYLTEARDSFSKLEAACQQDEPARAAFLAERLSNQIAALTRESATWSLRAADSAHLKLGTLHADILRHQEYERRLQAMVASRQALLAGETTLSGQQARHREVEVYQQRLARCREALAKLNRRLALRTR
ncbi:primosomal replication protein N'' [Salmonella enterica subsp. enterica serovar Choleraesuis]|nr:primosomal replication protein N'' [Salmonella enterica subsp. enterica serovar Choleraesuis]